MYYTTSLTLKVAMILVFFLGGDLGAAETQIVFGPQRYRASHKTNIYAANISILANQTSLSYRIKVKNGNGDALLINACVGTHLQRIMCKVQNIITLAKIRFFRPSAVEISFKNRPISETIKLNNSQAAFEKLITLTQVNQMITKVRGLPTAYAEVTIEKIIGSTDTTAPVILSDVNSGSSTNKNLIHILISDTSNVTTEIFKNNVLIGTQTSKEFDLTLTEGMNSFILKAKDSSGNAAANFVIENVILDTVPVTLWIGAKEKYYFQGFPSQVAFEITSNKPLVYLKIDSITTNLNSQQSAYSYSKILAAAGTTSVVLSASDVAGNKYDKTIQFQSILDNQAPIILLSNVPRIITTNEFLLPIKVEDLSKTKTTVEYDGIISPAVDEKDFSYLIEFPTDKEKIIKIVSTDEAMNQTTQIITITKDTSPLKIEFISPQANSVYNSSNIEIRLRANKLLSSATINGNPAIISADKIRINTNINLFSDGKYFFTAAVTDISGASATATIEFEIRSEASKSWTYEECSAELL